MLYYGENETRFPGWSHVNILFWLQKIGVCHYLTVKFHVSGIIQTMNFADNGRHLAEQDYTICMRQEEGEIGHLWMGEIRTSYNFGEERVITGKIEMGMGE
jgi:outer membrane receptor for Fe3+-dicitrate